MVAIVVDPEVDEDDRSMSLATLHEALFPARSERDGLLGVDLEEERSSAGDASEIVDALDAEEEAFAARVKAILYRRNMTQEQLAEALGIGQSAVSMLLGARHAPSERTVSLRRALGVAPEELWTGFQSDAPPSEA